jgi:hypothetical protein
MLKSDYREFGDQCDQNPGTMDIFASHIYHQLLPLLYRSESWRAVSLHRIHRWLLPALFGHSRTEPAMGLSATKQLQAHLGF